MAFKSYSQFKLFDFRLDKQHSKIKPELIIEKNQMLLLVKFVYKLTFNRLLNKRIIEVLYVNFCV